MSLLDKEVTMYLQPIFSLIMVTELTIASITHQMVTPSAIEGKNNRPRSAFIASLNSSSVKLFFSLFTIESYSSTRKTKSEREYQLGR